MANSELGPLFRIRKLDVNWRSESMAPATLSKTQPIMIFFSFFFFLLWIYANRMQIIMSHTHTLTHAGTFTHTLIQTGVDRGRMVSMVARVKKGHVYSG